MAEIERSKEKPKKIYKKKNKKRQGYTLVEKNGKENDNDESKENEDGEEDKTDNRESIKKSLEDQLEKKRNDFLEALLPYANELKDVDEKVVDDVLNQLADTLADAIDKNSDKDGNKKTEVADLDFEVVTKEKLKSWLEKHEDKISSTDNMKFEVVLLDKNGKRYEVSNSDTDVENIMDFLKEFSTHNSGDIPNLKEKLKQTQEELNKQVKEKENKKEKEKEIIEEVGDESTTEEVKNDEKSSSPSTNLANVAPRPDTGTD